MVILTQMTRDMAVAMGYLNNVPCDSCSHVKSCKEMVGKYRYFVMRKSLPISHIITTMSCNDAMGCKGPGIIANSQLSKYQIRVPVYLSRKHVNSITYNQSQFTSIVS